MTNSKRPRPTRPSSTPPIAELLTSDRTKSILLAAITWITQVQWEEFEVWLNEGIGSPKFSVVDQLTIFVYMNQIKMALAKDSGIPGIKNVSSASPDGKESSN